MASCDETARLNRFQDEYTIKLSRRKKSMLKIRFVSGMEMLAQELATGQTLFDPDWRDLPPEAQIYSPFIGVDGSPYASPASFSPLSPSSPGSPLPLWLMYENEYDTYAQPIPDPRVDGQDFGVYKLPSDSDFYGDSCLDITSPGFSPSSPYSPGSPCFSPSPAPPFPTDDPRYINWARSPIIRPTVRRRSQQHNLDSTRAFPVLFIEEEKVQFYSNLEDFETLLKQKGPEDIGKLILNLNQIVSVEKIIAYESFAQNSLYPDLTDRSSYDGIPPDITPLPLDLDQDIVIPILTKPEDEMFFQLPVVGGIKPYRYSIYGAPSDLYVTTDGWIRGFIEAENWPSTGYREFLIRILIEDSSIPVQTLAFDIRYRLNAL